MKQAHDLGAVKRLSHAIFTLRHNQKPYKAILTQMA
jgi:hypothetical protein